MLLAYDDNNKGDYDMYTAELYYQNAQGTPQTHRMPEFAARNLNHAIRRIVKTITSTSRYGMHTQINLWGATGESVHVYVNQVLGQHAGVTANDVFYPAATWIESFQG
jgi:hypothetical protein